MESSRSIHNEETPALNQPNCGLFVFTRFPIPGKTKTRLIPALGEQGAANLQKQMTEHLLSQFQTLQHLTLQIHFTGSTAHDMGTWLGHDLTLVQQCEGDLGERLLFALQQGFATKLQPIVIIGSDCPYLDEAQINQAFALLSSHDVVIGPATDGGYYLIGMNQLQPPLFQNIPWGSDRVFTLTQTIAQQQNLSIARLPTLSDIDRPEDIPLWNQIIDNT